MNLFEEALGGTLEDVEKIMKEKERQLASVPEPTSRFGTEAPVGRRQQEIPRAAGPTTTQEKRMCSDDEADFFSEEGEDEEQAASHIEPNPQETLPSEQPQTETANTSSTVAENLSDFSSIIDLF